MVDKIPKEKLLENSFNSKIHPNQVEMSSSIAPTDKLKIDNCV